MPRVLNFFNCILPILVWMLCLSDVYAEQGTATLSSPSPQNAPTSYRQLLTDLDVRIASFRKLVAERSNEWPLVELLAKALHERALLTGRVEDLGESLSLLESSFTVAPEGSGPAITAAKVSLSLHKLKEARRYLDISQNWKILPTNNRAANFQIAGSIALYRGEYESAIESFRNCELTVPGMCLAELATFYLNTGGYSEAEALYQRQLSSARSDQHQHRAWLNLQLAIVMMKRGQYEQAMAYLSQANAELPGWWLVREHIAEVSALLGRTDESREIYQEVVAETNLPQFMDALAELYLKEGKLQEAQKTSAQARKLWLEKLALYPEALSAHALGHFLASKSDLALALQLAQKNYENRPWGESKLLLSEAYLENDQADKAAEYLEQIVSSRYRSAEVYEFASRVYNKLKSPAKEKNFIHLCAEINPVLCQSDENSTAGRQLQM